MQRGLYQGFPTLEVFAAHYQVFNPKRFVNQEEQIERINWLYLIEVAKKAQKNGNSYRNFCVGCAVWAFKTNAINAGERWAVFSGSNIKVAKDARPVCAEQFAIGAAKSAGYDRIIAMVVVGEPQEDSGSGLRPKTLHPCVECRKVFQVIPEICPETLILTLTPNEQIWENFSIRDLIEIHRKKEEVA